MLNEQVIATKALSHKAAQTQLSNQLISKSSHFQIFKFPHLLINNIEQGIMNDKCSMLNEQVIATKALSHKAAQTQLSNQLISKSSHFHIPISNKKGTPLTSAPFKYQKKIILLFNQFDALFQIALLNKYIVNTGFEIASKTVLTVIRFCIGYFPSQHINNGNRHFPGCKTT